MQDRTQPWLCCFWSPLLWWPSTHCDLSWQPCIAVVRVYHVLCPLRFCDDGKLVNMLKLAFSRTCDLGTYTHTLRTLHSQSAWFWRTGLLFRALRHWQIQRSPLSLSLALSCRYFKRMLNCYKSESEQTTQVLGGDEPFAFDFSS